MDAHIPHPTPEDYLRGVMPDGTRPPLISRRLYDLWHKPLPGAHDPERDTLDKIARDNDFEMLRHYDAVLESLYALKEIGDREVKRERENPTSQGDCPSEAEQREASRADCPPTDDKPQQGTVRSVGNSAARGQSPKVAPITRFKSMMAVHLHVLKQIMTVATDRAAFIRGMLERAAIRDKRAEFIEDRAVAVVKQTLLALDDQFSDVGFGSWMPFRYPDQWLMFCGVMLRVLAANGMVHSKHADVYRRLLEETPPVEKPGPGSGVRSPESKATTQNDTGPRTPDVGQFVTPQSWSRSERAREVQNLAALFARNKPP